MDQIWPTAPTSEEAIEIEATLRDYLTKIQGLNRQMAHDQQEIDLLKAETRATLKNIHEIMDRLRVS